MKTTYYLGHTAPIRNSDNGVSVKCIARMITVGDDGKRRALVGEGNVYDFDSVEDVPDMDAIYQPLLPKMDKVLSAADQWRVGDCAELNGYIIRQGRVFSHTRAEWTELQKALAPGGQVLLDHWLAVGQAMSDSGSGAPNVTPEPETGN